METILTSLAILLLPLLFFMLYYFLWRKTLPLQPPSTNSHSGEAAPLPDDKPARIALSMSTPLALARIPTDILLSQRNCNLSQKEQKMLFAIHQNLEHLEELAHEINYGGQSSLLKFRALHLPGFIAEIRDGFDPMAASMNIRLKYKLDLDPGTEFLYTNKLKLEKIVLNLLVNAFFHSPQGGSIELLFQTRQLPEGPIQFKCTVTDSGPAIAAADLQHPERWNYRTNQSYYTAGTNANLLLSVEIAHALGGHLEAAAPESGGAAFTFSVRCLKAVPNIKQAGEMPALTEYAIPLPEKPIGTLHIIEADLDLREWFKLSLDKYFTVYTYPSANTFLQFATKQANTKETAIDAVLIDLLLPDMDGIELLQYIRQHPLLKSLPLLAFSTDCLPTTRTRALFIGVDDYIVKPIGVNELRLRILNVMRRFKTTSAEIPLQLPQSNGFHQSFSQNILQTIPENKKSWMAQLIQLIESNLEDEQMSVSFLAKNMAVSKRQLFRIVKETTGLSPNQLVQEIRLDKALHLLEQRTDLSVSDVAYSVGMVNPSYFAVAFKKRFNKSPSAYKK